VAGIPDLRVPAAAWVDFETDKADARRLAAQAGRPAADLAREVFGARAHWSEARVRTRTAQVVEGPTRARRELTGWLAPVAHTDGPVLEIGCGTGGLLAALPPDRDAIGLDVSLVWLVVASRLLAEHGRRPVLAAAVAEALPLTASSIGAIVALDVIEHVADLPAMLKEIDRVAAPGAVLACATPNRFSLAAEPHVGVWGVGWLPRRYQPGYVKWRTGAEYAFARLLSAREARRLIARHTRFDVITEAAPVPAEELARFSPRRAALARAYNRLQRLPVIRSLLLLVGPFFMVIGRISTDQPRTSSSHQGTSRRDDAARVRPQSNVQISESSCQPHAVMAPGVITARTIIGMPLCCPSSSRPAAPVRSSTPAWPR
jgi:SAM-dependent methyltransferase